MNIDRILKRTVEYLRFDIFARISWIFLRWNFLHDKQLALDSKQLFCCCHVGVVAPARLTDPHVFRSQLQREREETKESILSEGEFLKTFYPAFLSFLSEGKIHQGQLDSVATDLLDVLKKERVDRERAVESLKRRIDDEKSELQDTLDRDRANMSKKMNEEHDQRRIEQLEVQQRLENTEKSGKSDIAELFSRVKRYEEEARIDNDEVHLIREAPVLQYPIQYLSSHS